MKHEDPDPDSDPLRSPRQRERRSIRSVLFTALVGLISLMLLVGLSPALKGLVVNWLPTDAFLAVRTDLGAADVVHRLHSTVVAVTFAGLIVGLAAQLHRPRRKVAPLLMALVVPIALAVGELMTGSYTVMGTAPPFVVLLAVAFSHPAAGEMLRVPRMSSVGFGLAAVAAVPWVMFSRNQARLQQLGSAGDLDVVSGHWDMMTSFPILVLAWATIGASDYSGWRITAWVAGGAVAAFALQSIIFPYVLSGASPAWAAVALAWAVVYVSAAELRSRRLRTAEPREAAVPGVDST